MILSLFRRFASSAWREEQTPQWRAAVGDLPADALMAQPVTDDFHAKQGRSTGRWLVPASTGPQPVYLKRHYRLSLRLRLLAWLWPNAGWSPAAVEWRHLRWALARGIPAPEPLAVGEKHGPGLGFQSYLAIRELTGMSPLHEAVPLAQANLSPERFAAWKRDLVRELARLARLLHDERRFHKDLYLCHFFVPQATCLAGRVPKGALHLIDFHRLTHRPYLGWRWLIKDLAELHYSSRIPGVTLRDRVRFFRLYRGARGANWPQRLLARLVVLKSNRYAAHNADELRRLNAPRPAQASAPLPGAVA